MQSKWSKSNVMLIKQMMTKNDDLRWQSIKSYKLSQRDLNIENDQIPTVLAKLTAAPRLVSSDLFAEEGSEEGDVGDSSEDGDAAVEDDEGEVVAVRKPEGKKTISQFAFYKRKNKNIIM